MPRSVLCSSRRMGAFDESNRSKTCGVAFSGESFDGVAEEEEDDDDADDDIDEFVSGTVCCRG